MKIKEYARTNYTLKESYDRVSSAWIIKNKGTNRADSLILIAEAMKKPTVQKHLRIV